MPFLGASLVRRQLNNFLSKYCDPDWVVGAAARAQAEGTPWARVACAWNQMQTATGRLSSSSPNLQAVTKYQFSAATAAAAPSGSSWGQAPAATAAAAAPPPLVNIRSAFVAPEGSVLISADYSQIVRSLAWAASPTAWAVGGCFPAVLVSLHFVFYLLLLPTQELRILAHKSGDRKLLHLLRQAGEKGDAFNLIAAAFLGKQTGQCASFHWCIGASGCSGLLPLMPLLAFFVLSQQGRPREGQARDLWHCVWHQPCRPRSKC